jgi:hypothetical protein
MWPACGYSMSDYGGVCSQHAQDIRSAFIPYLASRIVSVTVCPMLYPLVISDSTIDCYVTGALAINNSDWTISRSLNQSRVPSQAHSPQIVHKTPQLHPILGYKSPWQQRTQNVTFVPLQEQPIRSGPTFTAMNQLCPYAMARIARSANRSNTVQSVKADGSDPVHSTLRIYATRCASF